MRHAPCTPRGPATASATPAIDPHTAFGGYAVFTAFQQQHLYHAAEPAAGLAVAQGPPPQIGINVAPGVIPLVVPQVVPTDVPPVVPVVPGAAPPPPPHRNILQNERFIGDIRDDMTMSSIECDSVARC